MSLELVKHRLPPVWDGWRVTWERYEPAPAAFICPPPPPERCACGSIEPRLHSRGLRHPKSGETFESTRRKLGRFGRVVDIPATVDAWPVYDLFAFRCSACGLDEVWDMRADEWWELGPEDYRPEGSERPVDREWRGGLFDLL